MKLTQTMLAQFTPQEVYDSIVYPLLAQNARATGEDGVRCLYRAPDGRRCAIGWIMPDSVYHKTLEFMGVQDIAPQLVNTNYADAFGRFLYRHMDMLRDFQEMHDARAPQEWPHYMRRIAQHYNLDASAVARVLRMFGRHHVEPQQPVITYRPVAPAYLLELSKLAMRDDQASHDMPERLNEDEAAHVLA